MGPRFESVRALLSLEKTKTKQKLLSVDGLATSFLTINETLKWPILM